MLFYVLFSRKIKNNYMIFIIFSKKLYDIAIFCIFAA